MITAQSPVMITAQSPIVKYALLYPQDIIKLLQLSNKCRNVCVTAKLLAKK